LPEVKPTLPTSPSTPTDSTLPIGAWTNKEWDKYLVDAINAHGGNLLSIKPLDSSEFIAVWPTDKDGLVKFWMKIFITMAKYESNWKPETKYQEKFKSSSTGGYVVSRGLFQISKSSTEQARYGCVWKNEDELHNPKLNIECSVKVANFLFGDDKRIAGNINGSWKGLARYWAVFRPTSSANGKKAFEAIKNANR
jgi:hypothetical protein